MTTQHRWTLETCREVALKYEKRSDWKKLDQGSYQAAKRNGWFDACVSHMDSGNKQWTKAECQELAMKYQTRNDFKRGVDGSAYSAARYNGWLEECCKHMVAQREDWTLEKCKEIASKYTILNQWRRGPDVNSYAAAYRNGWLEHCCAHMDVFEPCTFSEALASAGKYQTRIAWKNGDIRTYRVAERRGWSELCTVHMGLPNTISTVEGEVFDFVKAICPDAIRGSKTLLDGRLQLDIFIPSLKLGIEYNGLAWHSERTGRAVNYHQVKTDMAASRHIRIIHIWSDEWLNKRGVIESYLLSQLGQAPERELFARKCQIIPTTGAEQRGFLDDNHIQGFAPGTGFALVHGDEVVAVALTKINRNSENELVRLCFKRGVEVTGGFERLMAHITGDVVSFCDTAKFDGAGYLRAGWVLVGRSPIPVYWVNKNCDRRVNRDDFKKADMLSSLVEAGRSPEELVGKKEEELAAMLGLFRMGGCELLKFARLQPLASS